MAKYFANRGWYGSLADFCVATEYGQDVLDDVPGLSVIKGRLSLEEMNRLMQANGYGFVVDATHPYAVEVTDNIRQACNASNIPYLRLLREEGSFDHPNVHPVDSIEDAVNLLNKHQDRVLLTTGAKELRAYQRLNDIPNRVVARVLPMNESLEACATIGIQPKQVIAMQGPFSQGMNLATMEQYQCRWLVTKNTGKPGGFDDKLPLVEAGYHIIVIGRPSVETGLSLNEIMRKVDEYYGK